MSDQERTSCYNVKWMQSQADKQWEKRKYQSGDC